VQQAERDTSIKVTDQEVLDQVEQTYQNVRKQFTSENDFRDQIRQARFGSVEEWRRWLADEQRRQLYAQRLIEAQRNNRWQSTPQISALFAAIGQALPSDGKSGE